MVTATGAVVDAAQAPFTVQEIELETPRPHEVLVRMVATGMCHTDLSVRAGDLPFPLPGVLGHEGAGIVEYVGSAVTRVAPGDHVVLTFTSCGRCDNCRRGHPAYCRSWLPSNLLGGTRSDGSHTLHRGDTPLGGHFFGQSSFATHAIADEQSTIPVDPSAPLEVLAPLGCGVQTGVGTIVNVLTPAPDATLAVFGAGTVGLSAVLAAAWTPLKDIVVVDLVDSRLELARNMGATRTVNAHTDDVPAILREMTGGKGPNYTVETTGNPRVLRDAVDTLAARGTCAVVGAPAMGAEVSLDVNGLLPGRRVVGVTEGDADPESLIPLLARLHTIGQLPLDKLVTHYSFADIEQAAHDMHAGTTLKPVLRFDAE